MSSAWERMEQNWPTSKTAPIQQADWRSVPAFSQQAGIRWRPGSTTSSYMKPLRQCPNSGRNLRPGPALSAARGDQLVLAGALRPRGGWRETEEPVERLPTTTGKGDEP